jgi:alcohol dehydrogenase class IV
MNVERAPGSNGRKNMNAFNYFQPTEIIFGAGKLNEAGRVASRYGKACLLVTTRSNGSAGGFSARVTAVLQASGVRVVHFDGVTPNPTTTAVTRGAEMARDAKAELVIGLGGGSSMDAAKAIAVEAAHEGVSWDYLFFKKPPTERTLPIIAITTTSGTGSQTTPCAVITNPSENDKSALWHPNLYPKAAIVDPELMVSVPPDITAMTGFDAFCHNFEAYISRGTNPYVETLALTAIRLIVRNLPAAKSDGSNLEAREAMAWADTLGGLAIASGGVTLPHGLGMQISGHCPRVAHGQALAALYPEFMRFTWEQSIAKFAAVGRIFNRRLEAASDRVAAEKCCNEINWFLKRIGMWTNLKALGVSSEEARHIAMDGQVLPDYKNNPRVATLEEMGELMMASYERRL